MALVKGARLPSGFSEAIIPGPSAGDWNEAVGITFDPVGRMFVWERGGHVWDARADGCHQPNPSLDESGRLAEVGTAMANDTGVFEFIDGSTGGFNARY